MWYSLNGSISCVNTYHAGHWFYLGKSCLLSEVSDIFNCYFTICWTNTRHVGTHLNAFLMVIPNMVMKFHNFDIFTKFVKFLTYLSSAIACRVESINTESCSNVRYVSKLIFTIIKLMHLTTLCLTSRTTVTSACIPQEDAYHRARNLCVISHV